MSTRIDHYQKMTFTGTPDSVCKIGSNIYVAANTGSVGYIHMFELSPNGDLTLIISQTFQFTVKGITTDGNRLYAISDLDAIPKIIRAYDPVTLNTLGNTYNIGSAIYGPIHASTAGFVLAALEWVSGTSFDNTRLLRFDGSAFMEIARFPARLAYHVIGLRILSVVVSPSNMGYLYYLGTDRLVESTVTLPLAAGSGANVISKGAAIISETRVAICEAGRLVLYSIPQGTILDSVTFTVSGEGRMITDGRYLYITNSTTPNVLVYDVYGDTLRYVDSASFPSGEVGLTAINARNITYGSNMLFVLSTSGLHSFAKALAADFTISNPTPAVGETVTFEVI
jgi:hypothetical protein